MDQACRPHLAATVHILEPTLVILQGKALRALIAPHLKNTERIDPANEHLEHAEFAGVHTTGAARLAGYATAAPEAPHATVTLGQPRRGS